jgi:hypothetical protein
VNKFRKFERRKTVEEKDVHLEPDEDKDVEGHVNQGVNLGAPDDAVNLGANLGREDEGEDVEGHVNLGAPDQAVNLGREDEDDDVEGHVNLG